MPQEVATDDAFSRAVRGSTSTTEQSSPRENSMPRSESSIKAGQRENSAAPLMDQQPIRPVVVPSIPARGHTFVGLSESERRVIEQNLEFQRLSEDQQKKFLETVDVALRECEPGACTAVLQNFKRLLSHKVNGSSALTSKDRGVDQTLLDHLHALSTHDSGLLSPGLKGRKPEILQSLVSEILSSQSNVNQGQYCTCTIGVANRRLANQNPAEYARIIQQLCTAGAADLYREDSTTSQMIKVQGMTLNFEKWSTTEAALNGRSITESLFQTSFNSLVGGYKDGLYNDQVEVLYETIFGTSFVRLDESSKAFSALETAARAGQSNMVSLKWGTPGQDHANHALEVLGIVRERDIVSEGGRTFVRVNLGGSSTELEVTEEMRAALRNGPVVINYNPHGEQYPAPEGVGATVFESNKALFWMKAAEFESRFNYAMVMGGDFGITAGADDPARRVLTVFVVPETPIVIENKNDAEQQRLERQRRDQEEERIRRERVYRKVNSLNVNPAFPQDSTPLGSRYDHHRLGIAEAGSPRAAQQSINDLLYFVTDAARASHGTAHPYTVEVRQREPQRVEEEISHIESRPPVARLGVDMESMRREFVGALMTSNEEQAIEILYQMVPEERSMLIDSLWSVDTREVRRALENEAQTRGAPLDELTQANMKKYENLLSNLKNRDLSSTVLIRRSLNSNAAHFIDSMLSPDHGDDYAAGLAYAVEYRSEKWLHRLLEDRYHASRDNGLPIEPIEEQFQAFAEGKSFNEALSEWQAASGGEALSPLSFERANAFYSGDREMILERMAEFLRSDSSFESWKRLLEGMSAEEISRIQETLERTDQSDLQTVAAEHWPDDGQAGQGNNRIRQQVISMLLRGYESNREALEVGYWSLAVREQGLTPSLRDYVHNKPEERRRRFQDIYEQEFQEPFSLGKTLR